MLNEEDINKLKSVFGTKEEFNDFRSELKSFKAETRDGFSELNEKIDNLTDVMMENHDKRIEALEEKVLT